MADVKKCDMCGVLNSAGNPINKTFDYTSVLGGGIRIAIDLPAKMCNRDICKNCISEVWSSRFMEICGVIAPFKPQRVPGLEQVASETATLTLKEEKQLLARLARKLLAE